MLRALAACAAMWVLTAAARAEGDAMIEVERTIAGPVSEVWQCWTTAAGLESFLQRPAEVELRPGGKYEIYFAPDAPAGQRGSEGCTVLSYLPERMVSFSWNAPPIFPTVRDGARKTIVVVSLTAIDQHQTQVKLVHHSWPSAEEAGPHAGEWAGTRQYFENAWPKFLDALAARFKADDGTNAPDVKSGWVYLIVGLSRPDLITTMTEEEKQILGEHFEYLKGHTRAGRVVVAGPCTDGKGPGIVVFRADDEAAARAFMEGDPAVKHGIFKADLHPMRHSLVVGRD